MLIGVPAETMAGETRVAVTPETAKKLKSQGHTLRIQSGAVALRQRLETVIADCLAAGAENIHFLGTGGAAIGTSLQSAPPFRYGVTKATYALS